MISQRRRFFRNLVQELGRAALGGFQSGVREQREQEDFERFFESYESSYALTLNYPDEILLETARQRGIEVEGRDKLDIVKEMFRKREQDESDGPA